MNKTVKHIAVSAALIAATTGCIADDPFYNIGEGTLYLSTKLSSDVEVRSRAEVEGLAETCDIWIANEKGVVRTFNGTDQIPTEGIKLTTGSYKAMVWAGDSVPADWEARFFKGTEPFDISANDKVAVTVTGRIANSVVAVNFDSSVADVLTDYSMTVGHSQGKLTFDASTAAEEKRGYFMMNSRDKDLTWTLRGTKTDGSEYTRTGTIDNAAPATLYTMTVKCSEENTEIGGFYFDIIVEESTVDSAYDITIDGAPEIKGIGFDLRQAQRAEKYSMDKKSVWITATSDIKSLVLTCDYFQDLLEINGNDFDFFQMKDTDLARLIEEKGIIYDYQLNEQPDGSVLPTVKLTFGNDFTYNLDNGQYNIKIDVADANDKQASATLRLVISDAPVSTIEANYGLVWATHAAVSLKIEKEGTAQPYIKYCVSGSNDWKTVEATAGADPSVLTAELTDLQPGTKYDFRAATDDYEAPIESFTTEEAAQLPNNSFEDWSGSAPLYICKDKNTDMFWDSGNTGSATLKKNVTVNTTSPVHTGTYAISLESQRVELFGFGKFAAGNVFVGKYLETQGDDGVLGWGRPFSSRPRQLKVWAHYTQANIAYNDGSSTPDRYKKGNPDIGTIYVALMDEYTEKYNNEEYSVVVKTKSSNLRLFDPEGSDKQHIIAYGEHEFTESTPGSELVEITIDLDYDKYGYPSKDKTPTRIIVTASASKGGDYFAGGNSKLVLDDIQLVY